MELPEPTETKYDDEFEKIQVIQIQLKHLDMSSHSVKSR